MKRRNLFHTELAAKIIPQDTAVKVVKYGLPITGINHGLAMAVKQ
jgi:hypothetical protein